MDITDSSIVFDNQGVCDHCNTFYENILPHWHTDERGEKALWNIIEKIKREGQGKEFDCIMGMSGGIDSSYLTYVVKEKYGLHPLVFHVDAGWNSQIAVNNIERLVDRLGLHLFTHVIDWEEMKDLQLAYFKSGVPHIDVPQDHAFFATMYNFASKYKIKYILTGGNYSTECVRNPLEWMYYQSDSRQLKDIHRKFGQKPLVNYPITSILWHKLYCVILRELQLSSLWILFRTTRKMLCNCLLKNLAGKSILRSILNRGLQNFMKDTGFLKGLVSIPEKYNIPV